MKNLISLSVILAGCISAKAAIIAGVSVSADSTFNNGVSANNLVNNSGLSSNSFTATHAPHGSSFGQWHTAIGVTGNTNVTFSLNGTYDLQSIYIWNHNQTNLLTRGVNQFDILVSSNGTTFTEVSTDETLTVSSHATSTSVSAQQKALVQNGITHVRLHIDSNHGDTNVVGLAEVKFDGVVSSVPEPSSALLFAFSGLSLLYRRRRS